MPHLRLVKDASRERRGDRCARTRLYGIVARGQDCQSERALTSLALTCVSNMLGRGRELQGEWPRSLSADHVRLSA